MAGLYGDDKRSDLHALAISTQHLFPDVSENDLEYSISRFGLSGVFELSRAATIHPEKDLSDIIRYFRCDEAGQRIDDVYGIRFLQKALNEQGAQLPEEMFSLLSVHDKERIVCEEERNRVPHYLNELFARVRTQEMTNQQQTLVGQKRLTYQEPSSLTDKCERLQIMSGCTPAEAQEFCRVVPKETINVYFTLSQDEKPMSEVLAELRGECYEHSFAYKKKSFSHDTFEYVRRQGYDGKDALEICSFFGNNAVPIVHTVNDVGKDLVKIVDELVKQPELITAPLETIEAYIRGQAKQKN